MLQRWAAAREIYETGLVDLALIAACMAHKPATVDARAKRENWRQNAPPRTQLSDAIAKLSALADSEIGRLTDDLEADGHDERLAGQLASMTKLVESLSRLRKEFEKREPGDGDTGSGHESILEFRERLARQIDVIANQNGAKPVIGSFDG